MYKAGRPDVFDWDFQGGVGPLAGTQKPKMKWRPDARDPTYKQPHVAVKPMRSRPSPYNHVRASSKFRDLLVTG